VPGLDVSGRFGSSSEMECLGVRAEDIAGARDDDAPRKLSENLGPSLLRLLPFLLLLLLPSIDCRTVRS